MEVQDYSEIQPNFFIHKCTGAHQDSVCLAPYHIVSTTNQILLRSQTSETLILSPLYDTHDLVCSHVRNPIRKNKHTLA